MWNTTNNDARTRAVRNKQRRCSVPHCQLRRNFTSQYCSWHSHRTSRYGHYAGRYLAKQETYKDRVLLRKLVRKFRDHPAVLEAHEIVAKLITPSPASPRGTPEQLRVNARHRLRVELLRVQGITAEDALVSVAAVWVYSMRCPQQLPDDDRLTWALGLAVLRLKRLYIGRSRWDHVSGKEKRTYRKPSGRAAGLLGRRLRIALAPFIINLVALVERERAKQAAKAAALRTPFVSASK